MFPLYVQLILEKLKIDLNYSCDKKNTLSLEFKQQWIASDMQNSSWSLSCVNYSHLAVN